MRKLCFFLTLALAGCAGATHEDPIPVTSAAVVAASVDRDPTPEVTPKPVETFTDDQIVGLLSAYNKGEVELADIAGERAKDPRVHVLARAIGDDHHTALDQETRLADTLVNRPQTTDKMRDIEHATEKEAAKLRSMSGHDFDVEFTSNQASRERDTLAMLDVQLIPSAKAPTIRAHLADYRDRVDHHRRDAEELQRALGGPIIAASH